MKSKKLISLLCAAALSASAFAGLAIPASAAETTLWSDSFDGYANIVDHYTKPEVVGKVLLDGTLKAKNEYDGIEGVKLITTNRADDSSYFQITEGATGRALTTFVSRFSNQERGAEIKFDETYAPAANKDLVLAFKTKTSNLAETTYDTAIELNGSSYLNLAAASDWTNVKVVITQTGATAYVGDADGVSLASVKNLSSIKFDGYTNGTSESGGDKKAQTSHPLGYPTIAFDDMVVYTTDAGNGASSTVPAAQTHKQGDVTYETVPVAERPGKVEKMDLGLFGKDDVNNINNDDKGRLAFLSKDAASEFTGLNTVNVGFPQHSENRSETNWKVDVANTDPELGIDKYLKATSSKDSTANRGPRMYFKKDSSVYEVAEREAVVAQFTSRLHHGADADTQPAELVFSGDLVASESKGNLASPLAMVTTNAEANSAVYAVNNPLEKGGDNVLEVEDNEWFIVTITAYRSEGKTAGAKIAITTDPGELTEETTYIFGSDNEYKTIQDNTKSGVNNLPYITFRSGNSTDYGESGSVNDIDNIFVYSSTVDPSAEPTPSPTPAPTEVPKHSVTIEQVQGNNQQVKVTSADTANDTFDGVLIHASYANGKLADVEAKDLKNISKTGVTATLTNTVAVGDKFYVWNDLKGMIPYGTATATAGVTKYTVTATADNGLDIEADKASAQAGETVTLTVANTLTGVAFDGFETTGIEAFAIQAGAEDGKYTFTMPAANVTIRAKAKALVAPAAITKALATNGSFTVKVGDEEVQTAAEGASVVITPTANQGYKVGNVTVEPTDSSVNLAVPVTNNNDGTYTFTMPEVAVTVTVTFVEDSVPAAITKAGATNGSFTVTVGNEEVQTAAKGASVVITPTANQGYKVGNVTVAPTDSSINLAVPVTNNNDGTYTFTMPDVAVTVTVTFVEDSAPADPAITGTVTVTGDPVVGQKLTASVSGLNDGKTPKYQWQANTGANGAYENIQDATTNELTVPANLVGKTIKAVVTADGTTGSIESAPTAAVTVPTYTVTGTIGTGVANAVLRPQGAADATTDVAGTVEGTTATYTVPAGTYTVVVTAAEGYKNPVSTPATVTVSSEATTASFTASATAKVSPAVTITSPAHATVTVKNGSDAITSGDTILEGTTLTASAVADEGYNVTAITVKDADDAAVTVDANGAFTMPDKAVTVTATTEYTGIFTVTPDMTYVDFRTANKDTSYEGTTPALAGYINIKNNAFIESSQSYEDTAVMTVISIDASEYLNKVDNAVLSFKAQAKDTTKNANLRLGAFSKYVDIADEETDVKASNVNTLGGTASLAIDEIGNANGTKAEFTANIKDLLKGTADGKLSVTLITKTGRAIEISEPKVTITAAETAYDHATAVVHKVYADTEGAITIGNDKYTEFGTSTTTHHYKDDKFTPAYAATIDDKTATQSAAAAKYTYVSGGEEKTLVAGTNDIYLIYTRELYSDVNFTATLAGEGVANVPIVVTKADNTPVATYTTRAAKAADAEAGTPAIEAGTISTQLLAGEYKYTVAATAQYAEIDNGTFTVTANGTAVAVPVALQANTVKYNVVKAATTNGSFTTSVDSEENKAVQGAEITISTTPSTEDPSKIIFVREVTVSYTEGGENKTADVTTVTANSSYKFTMPAADVTVAVTFYEWDGIYYSQDFSTITDVADFGTFGNTGRTGNNSIADGVFTHSIHYVDGDTSNNGKRTKDAVTLPSVIDFSGRDSAKISFDVQLNPVGTSAKPTTAEVSFGNSDNKVLFAISRSDQESVINTYAGKTINVSVTNSNGLSNAYGANQFTLDGGTVTPVKVDESTNLSGVKDAWYHVELTVTGNTMAVKVYNKAADTVIGTATLDITDIKKDIKTVVFFDNQGSALGGGSNIKFDNFVVQNNVVTP